MQERFYTVDEIAQILDMHPKTIARYIREGRLLARKYGKAWRVSGHDLSVFVEGSGPTEAANGKRPEGMQDILERVADSVIVSTVADIPVQNQEEASLIMNFLTATVHADRTSHEDQSMSAQYISAAGILRINLWGSLSFVDAVLASLNLR